MNNYEQDFNEHELEVASMHKLLAMTDFRINNCLRKYNSDEHKGFLWPVRMVMGLCFSAEDKTYKSIKATAIDWLVFSITDIADCPDSEMQWMLTIINNEIPELKQKFITMDELKSALTSKKKRRGRKG